MSDHTDELPDLSGAQPILRGCGRRVKGGVYMEVALSRRGRPLEEFLYDPPLLVDEEPFKIPPIGVHPIEIGPTLFVIDWVGEAHYPNVLDVIEEGRRFGFSRRIPASFPFETLQPGSRLMLAHRKAAIINWVEYWLHADYDGDWYCPKGTHLGGVDRGPDNVCLGTVWHDLPGDPELDGRVTVTMPSFSYQAWPRPRGITPVYRPAVFIDLPLTRLVVVKDPEDQTHLDVVPQLVRSGLPVALVDE